MKSIIQSQKKCYITGRTENLHEHHVYEGSKRQVSEKYGLKIWLVAELHNMGDYGVHGLHGKALSDNIKREVQIKAMDYYGWTVEDFIRKIGRSYI